MNVVVISILIAAFAVLVGLSLISLRKIRNMHRMIYSAATRDDLHQTYRQLEALQQLYRNLDLRQALPPLRGYAASPDFLNEIDTEIKKSQPLCVVELGSGASTLVIARRMELLNRGHLYSLEHDAEYARLTRENLRAHGLNAWATVIHAPLQEFHLEKETYLWYTLDMLPAVQVNVLIIDGPPASVQRHARYPALPLLFARLTQDASVLVDDTARKDDAEVIDRWEREYPEFTARTVDCEKGCVRFDRIRIANQSQPQSVPVALQSRLRGA